MHTVYDTMAKLNYIKIGQGVLIGVDTLIGGFAYKELVTNFIVGITISILALVIAIIAFAPELEADVNTVIGKLNAEEASNPKSSVAGEVAPLLAELNKLKDDLAELGKIDSAVGQSGLSDATMLNMAKVITPIIQDILANKSVTSAQLTTIATTVFPAISKSLEYTGVLQKLNMPELIAAISDPAFISMVNGILLKIL